MGLASARRNAAASLDHDVPWIKAGLLDLPFEQSESATVCGRAGRRSWSRSSRSFRRDTPGFLVERLTLLRRMSGAGFATLRKPDRQVTTSPWVNTGDLSHCQLGATTTHCAFVSARKYRQSAKSTVGLG